MTIEWDGDDLMERMYQLADKVTDQMGTVAISTAQSLVPVDTGKLKSEIELKKSKFEGGGCAIVAQGPGNYDRFYATFVELGVNGRPAHPYLRPAIKQVRRIFKKAIQDEINK